MAVAYVQEFKIIDDDRTTEGYDAVAARLGDATIPGLILHTAGFDEDGGRLPHLRRLGVPRELLQTAFQEGTLRPRSSAK